MRLEPEELSKMLQHGRKAQSVLTIAAEQADAPKLEPPSYFNAMEVAEWRMLMDRLGDAWFTPECRSLTSTFISVSCSLDAVNTRLSKFDAKLPNDPKQRKEFADLVKLRGALCMQAVALATKLRIAPSTRNDRDRSATDYRRRIESNGGGPKPWEAGDEDGIEEEYAN